jgi:peptidoglycan/LPS O-acetylase OafA/YrhL
VLPLLSHSDFRSLRRFPALDGVRAIAVLLVVAAHSRGPGSLHYLAGWNGVTIFFVLSGFLITTLALREEERAGRVFLRGFYVRRVFRILPLYLLVLLLYVPIVRVLGIGDSDKFTQALPYYASPGRWESKRSSMWSGLYSRSGSSITRDGCVYRWRLDSLLVSGWPK